MADTPKSISDRWSSWWSRRLRKYAVRVIGVKVIEAEFARLQGRLCQALQRKFG